jgi:ABC-type iron transport system FetAB ATPase subunit
MPPPRLRLSALQSPLAGPFDVSVDPGECIAISGPSGSGKSLLLRMIADLDPNAGEIWLDGQPRSAISAPAWRSQVLYNAAETSWWHEDVAPHFHGAAMASARKLAPRLGLPPELLDGPVLRLSTGERQRLALARALTHDPRVLLADEPTGALDSDTTTLVETILRERLAAGMAIILVSHSPAQAARLGHRQLLMRDRHLHAVEE